MLAANSSHYQPNHIYMPSRPSPLAERSANALPHAFTFNMSTSNHGEKKPLVTPQRVYKPNPTLQTRDAATKRRRDMFFKRVQRGRDDKKWDSRGEQIQRLDYFSDQKRWEADKAREAPPVADDIVEEETYFGMASLCAPHDADEAEYILAQEAHELQELIAVLEEQQEQSVAEQQETTSQHYGSDDEDYDSIFMECATATEFPPQSRGHISQIGINHEDGDEMDMS